MTTKDRKDTLEDMMTTVADSVTETDGLATLYLNQQDIEALMRDVNKDVNKQRKDRTHKSPPGRRHSSRGEEQMKPRHKS